MSIVTFSSIKWHFFTDVQLHDQILKHRIAKFQILASIIKKIEASAFTIFLPIILFLLYWQVRLNNIHWEVHGLYTGNTIIEYKCGKPYIFNAYQFSSNVKKKQFGKIIKFVQNLQLH